MAAEHHEATLIPWYANGSLSEDERRVVDEHLPSCPGCRALLGEARSLVGLDGGALMQHVQAQHLEHYARDPQSMRADLEFWIREHVEGCDACAGALEGLTSTFEGAAAPRRTAVEEPSSAGLLGRLWAALSGTVLHPAAAAVYLLVALMALPVYRGTVGTSGDPGRVAELERQIEGLRGWGGSVDLPVFSDALRGDEAPRRITIEEGQPLVVLGAEFGLSRDMPGDAPMRFALVDASGEEAWSEELTVERVARNLAQAGIVTLLVPSSRLMPGDYRLVVTTPTAVRPLLDANLQITRG